MFYFKKMLTLGMQNNNITFFKSSQSYALIFCIVWGFHVRTLPAVPGC